MSDPDFALRYSRAQGYYVPIYQASRPRRRRMGRALLWLVLLAGASWVLTGCDFRITQCSNACAKNNGRVARVSATDCICEYPNTGQQT